MAKWNPFKKAQAAPRKRNTPTMMERGVKVSIGTKGSRKGGDGTGYNQSTSDTLKNLFPGVVSAGSYNQVNQSQTELRILRNVSRHLCSEVGLAYNFKRIILDNVLSRMPESPEFPPDLDKEIAKDISKKWARWCKKAKPFLNSNMNFIQAERQLLGSVIEDGEVLVRKEIINKKLRLEVYLSDRMYELTDTISTSGESAYMGVVQDKKGKPIAYMLYEDYSPRRYNRDSKLIRVDADRCIHIYDPDAFEQYRGRPWITAAILRIAAVKEYDTFSSAQMKTLAKLAMFLIKNADSPNSFQGRDDEVGFDDDDGNAGRPQKKQHEADIQAELNKLAFNEDIPANSVVELPVGTKVEWPTPQMPAAHWGSQRVSLLKDACAGLGFDYATLMCDHSQTNFSGARQGEINNRDRFMALQDFWHETYRLPIFLDWLENEYMPQAMGRLSLADYELAQQPQWTGKRWAWVDPLKDVRAQLEAVAGGLISPHDAAMVLGKDLDKNLTDLSKLKKMCDELDIPEVYNKIVGMKKPEAQEDNGDNKDPDKDEDEDNPKDNPDGGK